MLLVMVVMVIMMMPMMMLIMMRIMMLLLLLMMMMRMRMVLMTIMVVMMMVMVMMTMATIIMGFKLHDFPDSVWGSADFGQGLSPLFRNLGVRRRRLGFCPKPPVGVTELHHTNDNLLS